MSLLMMRKEIESNLKKDLLNLSDKPLLPPLPPLLPPLSPQLFCMTKISPITLVGRGYVMFCLGATFLFESLP